MKNNSIQDLVMKVETFLEGVRQKIMEDCFLENRSAIDKKTTKSS